MKKILKNIALSTILVCGITACGNNNEEIKTDSQSIETKNTANQKEEKNENSIDNKELPKKEEKKEIAVEKKEDKIENKENKESPNEKEKRTEPFSKEINVYYSDQNFESLKKVLKTVKVEDQKVATAALKALKEEDSEKGYFSPIPKEVELNSVSIQNGVATVKYTNSGAGYGTTGETMFVSAIVYTLTEFPTIDSVVFDSQGTNSVITHMDSNTVFNRDNLSGSVNIN